MKLNIGCGRDYQEGWINIDISRDVKAEHYLDIRVDPLPFEDNTFEWIYISGVLEQIGSNEELIFAMNECHRVLSGDGVMRVVVPNAKYAIAHQDPMDVRKFTPATFNYFMKKDRHYQLYGSVYGFKPWEMGAHWEENDRHILCYEMIKA